MSNNKYLGNIMQGTGSRTWLPSDLANTPYTWVDGDNGLTNLGDSGSLSITGYTSTGSQNGLTTRANYSTGNYERIQWPMAGTQNISTVFALIKGDSGWNNRAFSTLFHSNSYGSSAHYPLHGGVAASNTKLLAYQYSTVSTMAHTRIDGDQVNYVANTDWGDRSTTWRLYTLQAQASTRWFLGRFGSQTGAPTGNTGREFTGELAEFLVLEEELNLSDITRIEGYLMHKWGLASNLPSSHTYKSAAPTAGASQNITLGQSGIISLAEHYQSKV